MGGLSGGRAAYSDVLGMNLSAYFLSILRIQFLVILSIYYTPCPIPGLWPSPNFPEIKRGPVPRVTVKPRSWKNLEPHGAYRVMACGAFERPVVSIGWPRLLYGVGRDVQGIVPMETSSV